MLVIKSEPLEDNTRPLEDDQVDQFWRDGFLMARGLFDREEMDLLLKTARHDQGMLGHEFGMKDRGGLAVKLSLWNHPGDDIYGMFSRCRRVVDSCEQLLGQEVYHYHSKMILKEPRVGGAWEWHQDYGYWYKNGCLLPDMVSSSAYPRASANGSVPPGHWAYAYRHTKQSCKPLAPSQGRWCSRAPITSTKSGSRAAAVE